jgi:N,N'-diacetyl-8-epilegionaminate cytidylyltransferase
MKPYVVGFIFARGGSKGIPKKNVRRLLGKPLIAYAIETARSSALIDRVVVSTDNREIAEVARNYGADVPFMRPAELAQDDSPEWLAWQHAIRMLAIEETARPVEIFVCIPTTAPLRAVEDVDACIDRLMKTDADVVITAKPASRNPYFNMICVDAEGSARLVIPPEKEVHRRQSAPVVYDMTTAAYAARPEFVMRACSLFEGKVKAVLVPEERAVDIDTELDFQFAEFLLKRRGRNQNSKM